MLWAPERNQGGTSYERLLARFPLLLERLRGAAPSSAALGAGPFARHAEACVADRLVLLGDAAGYVDAITGEGLSMAFECASLLGSMLPEVLSRGASAGALRPYARAYQRRYRRYALVTRAVLSVLRHPRARDCAFYALTEHPAAFSHLVRWALGPSPMGAIGDPREATSP
jgi:flavin-dependent dehydrogenase